MRRQIARLFGQRLADAGRHKALIENMVFVEVFDRVIGRRRAIQSTDL